MRLVIAALLILASLTACDMPSARMPSANTEVHQVALPDGRTVVCITSNAGSGLQCDWDHAK